MADSSYGKRDALFLRDLGATEDPLVPDPDQPILMRQALHAFWISFVHPATGERQRDGATETDGATRDERASRFLDASSWL